MPSIEKDLRERECALNPAQSFIVQAPAGSGKTELLIQRFLALLGHAQLPQEILAITFTKKAAAEMRMRILKTLENAAQDFLPTKPHEKITFALAKKVLKRDQIYNWNLLDNPNQLRVQTIDSFCAYLTKQLPIVSQFGSQPEISSTPFFMYQAAAREVLMHLEENFPWREAIQKLLLHFDNDLNKLHGLLITMLAKRDQWLPYIHLNQDDQSIKEQLELHLGAIISEALKRLESHIPKQIISELMSIIRFAAENVAQTQSDLLQCRDHNQLPKANASELQKWRGISTLLLTKQYAWRKRLDVSVGFPSLANLQNPTEKLIHADYRQRFQNLMNHLQHCDTLKHLLAELFILPSPSISHSQWELLQALLQVLKVMVAQLRIIFQQQGQIDFIENTQAALNALGNEEYPTDLFLALDYQIKHLLIDEFQDTSITHYQLLEKLIMGWEENDGRTLFIVGDPMQSIYRFRDADVGLFMKACQEGLGNIRPHFLKLCVNFRSTEKLIAWNNQNFKQLFPSYVDIATGAVPFSESIASQSNKTKLEDVDAPVLNGFLNQDDQIQAEKIVQLIHRIRSQQGNEKIAILARSRSHLGTIIPALKKAKLHYQAIDIDPLTHKQTIQDLFSLTCALCHPADRLAWFSVFRAPWCGLTLEDLLRLAKNSKGTILSAENSASALSADGQQRFQRVMTILKNKMLNRERYDLRS